MFDLGLAMYITARYLAAIERNRAQGHGGSKDTPALRRWFAIETVKPEFWANEMACEVMA